MTIARLVVVSIFLPLAAHAAAGVEAAPGAHRPDWVIWAALGGMMILLVLVILGTQGDWRGKGRDKKDRLKPPYF
jgi:hypothetical protein